MNDKSIVEPIIKKYYQSFLRKTHNEGNNDRDFLMDIFNISPSLKQENRQYWGRELGMLWQLLVVNIAKNHCVDYAPALRFGRDEPCDLIIGQDAIDTKYRVGSGDSGTHKKFKQYGELLISKGYNPVFLMVRNDNLPAAITACQTGGWKIYTGELSLTYLKNKTSVDISAMLKEFGHKYHINP